MNNNSTNPATVNGVGALQLAGATVLNAVLFGATLEQTLLYMRDELGCDIAGAESYKNIATNPGNKGCVVYLLEVETTWSFEDRVKVDNFGNEIKYKGMTLYGSLLDHIHPPVKTGNPKVDAHKKSIAEVVLSSNHEANAYDKTNLDYKAQWEAHLYDCKQLGIEPDEEYKKGLQEECRVRSYVCFIKRNGLSVKFAQFGTKDAIINNSCISGLLTATFGGHQQTIREKTDKVEKRQSNIFVA